MVAKIIPPLPTGCVTSTFPSPGAGQRLTKNTEHFDLISQDILKTLIPPIFEPRLICHLKLLLTYFSEQGVRGKVQAPRQYVLRISS